MLRASSIGRPVLLIAVVLVATVTVLLAVLWLVQRRLIYVPAREPLPAAAEVLPGGRDVTLRTADGLALGGWYVPAQTDGYTVLLAGGNGRNRLGRAPLARALADAGFAVLLFDYRGYGDSPGSPSEPGLAMDVRAAYRHLVDVERVPARRIIFFGESLGSAVVTELATEHRPAGLVLRSPFVSLAAAASVHYPLVPVRLLLKDRYPVAELIERVDVPTVVVYGTRDSVVPPEQSHEVASRAPGLIEEYVLDGAGHNDDAMTAGPRLVDAVRAVAAASGS
jgi:pimeloyl-ACP methyl ester carboxylesterase